MVKLGVAAPRGPETFPTNRRRDGTSEPSFFPISCLPEISGKQKKAKKKMAEQKKSLSLNDAGLEGPRSNHHPALCRSKTYDMSFSKEAEKDVVPSQPGNSVSNLAKHTVNFHRVFRDLEDEELLETFSCAWQKEMSYHGRLFITNHHVCFYCSMQWREVKLLIPVWTITAFKKANTAFLVPNAVCIRTDEGEKFVFGSLRSRETVYQLLRTICKHLQDGSQNGSPTMHRQSTDHLQISLVQKEMDGDSPDSQMILEEPGGAQILPARSDTLVQHPPRPTASDRGGIQERKRSQVRQIQPNLLNVTIFIYLLLAAVLLLSSGYIGLRIVQLEEQLTSLGAWPELDVQHQYKAT